MFSDVPKARKVVEAVEDDAVAEVGLEPQRQWGPKRELNETDRLGQASHVYELPQRGIERLLVFALKDISIDVQLSRALQVHLGHIGSQRAEITGRVARLQQSLTQV